MNRRSLASTLTNLVTAAVAVVTLSLAGCASTPEDVEAADDTPEAQSASTGSEFSQGETPVPVPETSASKSGPKGELKPIYFDFDRSNVRSNMKPVLSADAQAMIKADAAAIIAGHADERGSEEYNLALGQRRAERVVKYLEGLGVARSNMVARSYGEAMPAVRGHDESAWRWNRRAELEWQQ